MKILENKFDKLKLKNCEAYFLFFPRSRARDKNLSFPESLQSVLYFWMLVINLCSEKLIKCSGVNGGQTAGRKMKQTQ